MKHKSTLNIAGLVKREIVSTKGADKFLLVALFFNIPGPGTFIPWMSQAFTIIMLLMYIRRKMSFTVSIPTLFLTIVTMIIQIPFIWVPFATQITSLVLISLIYLSGYVKSLR